MPVWTVRALLIALLVYGVLCLLMFLAQRKLQYFPDRAAMPPPASLGLRLGEVQMLSTTDGENLVTWWVPPSNAAHPVYLYLHGNGANLVNRAERFQRLTADGAGLLAVSWRGYGGSSGSPTEAGLMQDAQAAYRALAQRVAPQRIVIYGESLGTTVAVMLAQQQPAAALVLDSSFSSALAVAQGAYPWLPVSWLLRDTYRADLVAAAVTVPVLQVHCTDDPVTPLPFARRLNALLPGRQDIVLVPGRCHVPAIADYAVALKAFVARHVRAGSPAPA
jgi:uncharacterized protein